MSRRRRPRVIFHASGPWITFLRLRPVEAARRDRVRRQIQRVRRRAARRWTA